MRVSKTDQELTMPEPADKTPKLTHEQWLAQTRKELIEDGTWEVLKGPLGDDDDENDFTNFDDEIEIVLFPGSDVVGVDPICRVEQTGQIGKEIAAHICAAPDMARLLRDFSAYFANTKVNETERALIDRAHAILAKLAPQPT